MLTGKKIILFGAGIVGRRAYNFFGSEKVHCFADNNKTGQEFCGKPVISFDELKRIHTDYDVVISVSPTAKAQSKIKEQLENDAIPFSDLESLMSHEDFESNPAIRKFKDKHKGERCFLIGNGPSLRAEDLTVLHNHGEICFGCNAISKIFAQTSWRPNYYMAIDSPQIATGESGPSAEYDSMFFPALADTLRADDPEIQELFERYKNRISVFQLIGKTSDNELRFTDDASKGIYNCGTVMYSMIQLAFYMGFTTIYLLGVDHTLATPTDIDAFLKEKRHFYEDEIIALQRKAAYCSLPDTMTTNHLATIAYRKAEKYTQEHGTRIYNATRGGKLEVFERTDFDSLFPESI